MRFLTSCHYLFERSAGGKKRKGRLFIGERGMSWPTAAAARILSKGGSEEGGEGGKSGTDRSSPTSPQHELLHSATSCVKGASAKKGKKKKKGGRVVSQH